MTSMAERTRLALAAVDDVPSPCLSVCQMGPVGSALQPQALCKGCLRSIDEIAQWAQLSDDDKRAIWRQLPQREQELFT